MSETAQIIIACASVMTAVGTVLLGVSKLGPFVNSVSKFMTERHKRLTAADAKTTNQPPAATNLAVDIRLFMPSSIIIVLRCIMFISLITLMACGFYPTPPSTMILVTCVLSGANFVISSVWLIIHTYVLGIVKIALEN